MCRQKTPLRLTVGSHKRYSVTLSRVEMSPRDDDDRRSTLHDIACCSDVDMLHFSYTYEQPNVHGVRPSLQPDELLGLMYLRLAKVLECFLDRRGTRSWLQWVRFRTGRRVCRLGLAILELEESFVPASAMMLHSAKERIGRPMKRGLGHPTTIP